MTTPVLREIAAVIGEEPALRLALAFGGRRLFVPDVAGAVAERRRRIETAVLSVAGLSSTEIARTLGGTDRHARRLAAEPLAEVLHGG